MMHESTSITFDIVFAQIKKTLISSLQGIGMIEWEAKMENNICSFAIK